MQILDSRVKRGVEVASEKKMKDKLKTVMPGATPATTNTSASTGGLGISSSLDASFLRRHGLERRAADAAERRVTVRAREEAR